MVKYLFEDSHLKLTIILLLAAATCASKVPVPTCNAPRFSLSDLPISIDQQQTFNLNDFFSGYNLNLTILNKPEFVTMRQKIVKLKDFPMNQPGLRNYHLAHEGNNWGKTLVTLSVSGNDTILRWGQTSASETIPQLTSEAIVTSDPNVRCFDGIWIPRSEIAMVDCIENSTFGYKNYFYYLNTTTKAKIGKVFNDMYVPFTRIWHRKIRLHTEDGTHYLIRAFFAEHVNDNFDDNTYLEILAVNNPMKPWTIRVIDRSFLQQDKLSVMDFQVYMGDIYILDYHSGVIQFDITKAQTIVITGRYRTDSGFTKLGLYTSVLDNIFYLILAHDHALFEIDWGNQIKPQIITKYSIPDGSWIHDIWVNEQYVVAQLTANLTSETGVTSATQSTYVFSRGSRTYLSAYAAIPHPNLHSFVDFQRDTGQLMTIDTQRISVYQVSVPTIYVNPKDKTLLGKQFKFIVKADSRNEYTNESISCSFTFAFLVVPIDSLAIWPTGLSLPKTYYANYPGQLFIPIDRYAFGSNITYTVSDKLDQDPPLNYFLHQNHTLVSWYDKQPSNFKYTFLRTEQYDSLHETVIFVYTQNYVNDTHFSLCITVPYTEEVHCFDSGYAPHINFRISNLTANRFHYYEGNFIHLAAILYEDYPNEVFIYDIQKGSELGTRPITFDEGYQGKIQSIEFIGQYLVVVLRYVKEIVIFDMVQCWDHQERECSQVYRINAKTMLDAGVKYFAPVQVYASDFHPYVLFIQCIDRVIILDIGKNGPEKLAEIMSPATQEPGFYKWKMGIAQGELILVNPPNTIEEHDLDEMYQTRDAPKTKSFPTFGYEIPDKFDLDFSDQGNMIYITAKDNKLPPNQNSVILVYKTGLPAVASLYDVFNLNLNYDDILIDATGNFGDYITVVYGSNLTMFRQYEIPILVFQDSFSDYSFNLSFTNHPQESYNFLVRSQVKIANYPEDILVNDTTFNGNILTNSINYGNSNSYKYEFNDSAWFNGSVVNYSLICDECGQKIRLDNHVQYDKTTLGIHDMVDYTFAASGGYIQQSQSIITLKYNSSIDQFVSLPSVLDGEECMSIEHSWIYDYTLSACKNGNEVYLYTTVYSSFKPFVLGPYYSSAKHVTGLGITQDLLMVVDVDERPWTKDRQGGILIYAMNHDPFEPEPFDQIEYINSDDLQGANDWPGGPCYIGNAHYSYTNQSDIYRLIITELYSGFFVLDFKWVRGRKSVEIIKVEFINLKEELIKINYPLPNMAHFTAIAITKEHYNDVYGYWQTELVIVTSNFHNFELTLHIDKASAVVIHEITKIYYRYGFYESENYIKAFDGYFATAQRLPTMLDIFDIYSKMVLTVYDTRERWELGEGPQEKLYAEGTRIPIVFMLGGAQFGIGKLTFDWNFTMTRNSTDPFRRLGLVTLHARDAEIKEFSVHQRLHIITEAGLSSTQDVTLRAQNDYHQLDTKFQIIVPDDGSLPGYAIALITIGSIGVAAAVGYLAFLKFVKGKKPNRESQAEKSLLQREGQDDEEESSSEEQGQEESSDQDDGEQEGQAKEESKEAVIASKPESVPSINRETITSVDEGQGANKAEERQSLDEEEEGEQKNE